jgi:hypothetical protein
MTTQNFAVQKTETNRFANVWLFSLMIVLGLTAMVTAVLVAWPLVAYIASRLFV